MYLERWLLKTFIEIRFLSKFLFALFYSCAWLRKFWTFWAGEQVSEVDVVRQVEC